MDWINGIKKLAMGYSEVLYFGKRYGVTQASFNDGKSLKIYAEELGGKHFISFNYYTTARSNLLKPCEMDSREIIHFLQNYTNIKK